MKSERPGLLFWLILFSSLAASAVGADDAVTSVADLTARAKQSLVAIRQGGRTGGEEGIGSGFVIRENGLIATNFHVIGEGRSILVELPDGTEKTAVEVHAWDRTLDLAIIRIDAGNLRALPLAEGGATLPDGTKVIALGAPQGLRASVVEGVVSARRDLPELPDVPMLQIAMPIEPGNSGGPVLSMDGRVQGIVTLRSMRTPNLGFAMPAGALRVLLEKPNPMAIERWQTIGALDARQWERIGGDWSQRAGEIRGDGRGPGFGGRTLCLRREPVTGDSFDLSVRVKLDDESGAAGLAFCSDGGDAHYGFYPTNGSLRLTRFEGPDVFTWKVLEEVRSEHYRPGEWNVIHVRVDPERITCFLNGQKVIESADTALRGGRAGLCKFRQTAPAFRRFRLDPPTPESERESFLRTARQLEEQSKRLRDLADRSHHTAVENDLRAALGKDDAEVDLIEAALLVARIDDPELEVAPYRDRIRGLAEDFQRAIGADAASLKTRERLERLNEFFFRENGFHGARFDYENRANSHLNEVLDDREGLPITLCILYREVGRCGGLDIAGVSRPGQFVVRVTPPKDEGPPVLIDVFEGGTVLDEPETAALPPATNREIILRMLQNLKIFSLNREKPAEALVYANVIVSLDPEDPNERLSRAWLSAWERKWDVVRRDVDWLKGKDLGEPGAAFLDRITQQLAREESRR